VEDFSIPGSAGSDRQTYENENTLHTGTLGIRIKPSKIRAFRPLTLAVDGEVGRADHPLTPVSERNYHTIGGRAEYRTRRMQVSGSLP
jgi:hypothetical protein